MSYIYPEYWNQCFPKQVSHLQMYTITSSATYWTLNHSKRVAWWENHFIPITSSGRSVQFGSTIPYCLAIVHSSLHSTMLILSHSSLEAKYEWPFSQSQRGKEVWQMNKPDVFWQSGEPTASEIITKMKPEWKLSEQSQHPTNWNVCILNKTNAIKTLRHR